MHKSIKKTVLFVCTHNSARSQMAEGLLNSLCGNKFEANSVGTAPTTVNPHAVQVMSEIGIDISKHRSKSINEFMKQKFEDPASFKGNKADTLSEFRRIRDEIKAWISKEFK